MQDSRSSLLVLLTTILLVLLLALSGIWGYNYYTSKKEITALKSSLQNSPKTEIETTRDSLQKIYAQTISSLDNTLDSTWSNADSLKGNLDLRLNEFYKLRSEISSILKNNPNAASLTIAQQKIGELQQKVENLRLRYNDVEAENRRLNALLQQLNTSTKNVAQAGTKSNVSNTNETVLPTATSSILFKATQLKLAALATNKETETTLADEVEKLVGSFTIKNNTELNGAEIFIVVTQPNGKVLKNSAWETGLFETKEDGRKMYSQKLRFDYSKGEAKRCNFSISADKYPKGNYTMEIYHNGVMIANTVKTLS